MRETKFRVWEKVQKVMLTDGFALSPKGEVSFYWNKLPIHSANAILMQYTGLCDKNGKEIFEGDIVLANGSESVLDYDFSEARKFVSATIQDSRHFEKRRSKYKAYWQDNFSQFSFMSLSEPKHSINSDVGERDFEIIGNIYETPKLINP